MKTTRPDPSAETDEAAAGPYDFVRLFGRSAVPTALISVDAAGLGTIRAANAPLGRLLGYPDLVGHNLTELADKRDRPTDEPNRARFASGSTDVFRRDKRYVRSDGVVVPLHTYAAVIDRLPQETLVVTVFLDDRNLADLEAQFRGMDRLAGALAELRSALLREEPTQSVLELICSWARRILEANHAGVMELVQPGLLRIRAVDDGAAGIVGSTWPVSHAQFGEALVSRVATRYELRPDELGQVQARSLDSGEPSGRLFLAMAPVLTAERTVGALVASRSRAAFSDEELALLELFASEVSEALTVAQLRTDLERLAVIEDRERIARNLHDEIVQDLIGVRLGLVHFLQRAVDAEVREQLGESLRQVDLVTTRLRDVVEGLEPGASLAGFRDALTSTTSSKAHSAHIGWSTEIVGDLERLAADERVEILRVVNEAVSNVVRHSDATQVGVTLRVTAKILTLVVDDDGIGFDDHGHMPGMGLRNLKVRALERGGTFEISESSEGGTRLCWSIPLRSGA